jgi:aryl-alcohol dehydrogenase-like predicted oxidoreductase
MLRIRLVIPPEKERILVMYGQIQLVSGKLDIPLASSTFGIPQLESRKARGEYQMEDMIYCKGDVWVEDAITKKNRCDVGTFSFTKLNTSTDSRDFTITVPQQQSVEIETPSIKFRDKTKDSEKNADDFSLPAVPSLDPEGELPRGAYFRHGSSQTNPKDHCRLALALDVTKRTNTDELDKTQTVRDLQRYFDNGFQTFHIKSGSTFLQDTQEEILGRFFMETPQMAKDTCNVVIPMKLPILEKPSMASLFVRKTVTSSLLRLGLESIDCIQLYQDRESASFLDVLESLEDLKREGLVQSISLRNIPLQQIRNAHLNDFEIASSQIHCSILDPSAYTAEQKLLCSDLALPLLVESSLAGGLLSDLYLHKKFEPLPSQLSVSSRHQLVKKMPVWNKRLAGSATTTIPWQRYQTETLPVLSHIALKHRVSIATVCLRWVLQLDHVASSIVSCSLLGNTEDGSKITKRIKSYRDVFRFELDEDDMQQLWELSGMEDPVQEDMNLSF